MPRTRSLVILAHGSFSIAAGVLLFRAYMTALNGLDAGIGLFFGSSFLWVALGVWASGRSQYLLSRLAGAADLLLLAYIPTFFVSYGLIVFLLQEAAGAQPHTLATLGVVVCASVATAPVCLLAGLLFPPLIRWREAPASSADRCHDVLGRVYVLEALGAVAGGLAVTGLLYLGISPATILAQRQWARIVPDGTLEGSFSTAQADYLYGADGNDWVVARNGRIYETVGDTRAAGTVAALVLAQNTQAEHVLVIGDGLSVCRSLLKSSEVKTVDWFTPDLEYAESMLAYVPEALAVSDSRLRPLAGNIRDILQGKDRAYDIVLVNLPGAVSAATSPLLSVEFFERVNQSLRPAGLLALGLVTGYSAGAGRPDFLGASVKSTLDAVFAQTVLAQAEGRTFFLSAPMPYLQRSPVTLQARFSLLENAGDILPAEDLATVYDPAREGELLDAYDAAALPDELVASDSAPRHYLGQLLQAAESLRIPLAKPALAIHSGGATLVLLFVAVFALVRLFYILATTSRRKPGFDPLNSDAFQSDTLIATGSSIFVSIATFIALIYLFQMQYGTLHLYLGVFAALFALGLAAGIAALYRVVSSFQRTGAGPIYLALCVLAALIAFQAACLIGAGLWIERLPLTPPAIAVCTVLSGLFCGGALAVGVGLGAPRFDSRAGRPDHAEAVAMRQARAIGIGAAVGSIVAAFLLVPLLASHATFYVIAALALAHLVCVGGMFRQVARPGKRRVPHPVLTPAGYGLFALAACVIVGAHFLSRQNTAQAQAQATTVIDEWVQGRRLTDKTATVAPTSKQVVYHEVRERSELKGYIFRSEDFTGTVYGYAGPMSVIAFTEPNGTLIDFRITRSRETPRYISRIRGWMDSLKGKRVFGDNPMAGVNTVSGATLSSRAILRLLGDSGQQFATAVFGSNNVPQVTAQGWTERVDWSLACWGGLALIALGAIFHGRLWSRLLVLALTVGVAGFWLNRQFSTDHVIRLLTAKEVLTGSISGLCLLLGVPLLVLLCGNLFCGYLCPFGALQELVGVIVPKRFKAALPLRTVTLGRALKYAVLFVLVVAFFATGSKHVIEADPLTSAFDRQSWLADPFESVALVAAVAVLVGALFVTRLWCRYLCPTGAFLSLFNRGAWLSRLLPAKKFGRCEFGLSGRDHLDCIHCDRCRYQSGLVPARSEVITTAGPNVRSWLFMVAILVLAVLMLSPLRRKAPPNPPAPTGTQIIAASQVGANDYSPSFPSERPSRQRRGRRDR